MGVIFGVVVVIFIFKLFLRFWFYGIFKSFLVGVFFIVLIVDMFDMNLGVFLLLVFVIGGGIVILVVVFLMNNFLIGFNKVNLVDEGLMEWELYEFLK